MRALGYRYSLFGLAYLTDVRYVWSSKTESALDFFQRFNISFKRGITEEKSKKEALAYKTQVLQSVRAVREREELVDICVEETDRVFTTSKVSLSNLTSYIDRGAKRGNCEVLCEDLCFDEECKEISFKQFGKCVCRRQKLSICVENTKCNDGRCECLDGYCESFQKLDIQWLYQDYFEDGTLIIDKPGTYYLAEDITFCPVVRPAKYRDISSDAFQPLFPNSFYDEYAFSLGFPSAIAVVGENIKIHLNGFTLQQCEGHLLVQRFFSLIGLALQPFTANNGPHNFVNPKLGLRSSKNVSITGPGKLGRTAHHGIFGNENSNIVIKNVIFEGYEVAAIHFNQIDGLVVEGCTILGTRRDVPVLGMFSASIFIRPYIKELASLGYSMTLRNQNVSAQKIYDNLSASIENVYTDVLRSGKINSKLHPLEYALFANPLMLPEGSCYGIVVYGEGPASNGFATELEGFDSASKNIVIRNNTITGLKCYTKEYPAVAGHQKVAVDARGAVLQFEDTFVNRDLARNRTDGSYIGNIVSDAQVMVAKAILGGMFRKRKSLQNKVNTIQSWIIKWAEGVPTGKRLAKPKINPAYICHGDAMHHVDKGVVGIRLEETVGFVIEKNVIKNLENFSPPEFQRCSGYHAEADEENGTTNQAANIRAISASAARGFVDGSQSRISLNKIVKCYSENANSIIGINVHGDTKQVDITGNYVDLAGSRDRISVYDSLLIGENTDDQGANSTIKITNNVLYPALSNGKERRNLRIVDTSVSGVSKDSSHFSTQRSVTENGGCPYSR